MAVFAGSWLDGDGNPFDPGAYAATKPKSGQVAAVRRTGRPPHSQTGRLAEMVRLCANEGWWDLTDGQRADWQTVAGMWTRRRDSQLPIHAHQWIVFLMCNAASAYHENVVEVPLGVGWFNGIFSAVITSCSEATQQFSGTLTLVDPWQPNGHQKFFAFQVDPVRVPPDYTPGGPPVKRIRGYYHTRLAGSFDAWQAGVKVYPFTFICSFGVFEGDVLTVQFRLRIDGGHWFTVVETFVVTA